MKDKIKTNDLISLLESQKPKNIKIRGRITKNDLIKNMLEEVSFPTMSDIYEKERKGLIGEMPMAEKKEEEPKTLEIGVKEEEEEKDKPKRIIKYATDLGIKKALIFDENFKKILTPGYEDSLIDISDVFEKEEVEKILTPESKWTMLKRDPIYCLEAHLDMKIKQIRCFNPRLNQFITAPTQHILKVYKRTDDDERNKSKMIPDRGKPRKYIPMAPAQEREEVAALPVANKKYAIALQLPQEEYPFLFKLAPTAKNFFFTE